MDLLAWKACYHRGSRRFVSVTITKEGNLVANVRQYAMLRERQDADCQEFQPEGTLLQQTATWVGSPADPPAGADEMEVEEQRREAALAARRRAALPAQVSAIEIDHAR